MFSIEGGGKGRGGISLSKSYFATMFEYLTVSMCYFRKQEKKLTPEKESQLSVRHVLTLPCTYCTKRTVTEFLLFKNFMAYILCQSSNDY